MVKFGTADELKHSIRRDVIQFSLNDHIVDESLLKRIRDLDFVNDIIINNTELSVIVVDAETALPVVMDILRNGGISVKKISMTRPTLDDVFLKYAGTISLERSDIREIKQIKSMSGKG